MNRILFFASLLLICFVSITDGQKALLVKSPSRLPESESRIKIFLGGSIDMGKAENWQSLVEQELINANVIILNPRRDDWNTGWKPVSSDSNFRIQVEWELAALEYSDLIVLYFAPDSQSPISLLEFGLYARSKKLMVVCPEGYWRKGNVDLVAEKYNIERFNTLSDLIQALKRKIGL